MIISMNQHQDLQLIPNMLAVLWNHNSCNFLCHKHLVKAKSNDLISYTIHLLYLEYTCTILVLYLEYTCTILVLYMKYTCRASP
ncbi:hypothetical protein LINGRAHAP2_LOCUS30207 [Linum grandiflorum]